MITAPVESLACQLHAQGVSFRRRGEHLAVQGAKNLSPDVLEAVRLHKADLLALCDRIDRTPSVSVNAPAKLPPEGVRWHSGVLGETILLLPDAAPLPADTGGLVIYRRREIAALRGISPSGLKWLHEVKRVWGGDVLP